MNVGSTVTVKNVFYNYPVRCKDLKKNIKKEYAKFVSTLQAFAVCFPTVKFSCTNEIDQKTKQMVLSTSGGAQTTSKSAIITVFGSKQWECIIPWQTHAIPNDLLSNYAIDDSAAANQLFANVSFSGFVSSIAHGSGRSMTDRQLLFLNKRPCELPKFTKAVNEAYKQFNSTQYPFICLFMTISSGYFDVNVTPDKRNIFLKSEKIIIALLRHSALQIFRINAGHLTDLTGDVGIMKNYKSGLSSQPSVKVSETMMNFFSVQEPKRSAFSQPVLNTCVANRKDAIMAELSAFSFNSKENNNPESTLKAESFSAGKQGSTPCRTPNAGTAKRAMSVHSNTPHLIKFPFDVELGALMPPLKTPKNDLSGDLNELQSYPAEDIEEIIDSQEDFKQVPDIVNDSRQDSICVEEMDRVPFHLLSKDVSVDVDTFECFYAAETSSSRKDEVLKERNFVVTMEDKNAENELRRALSKSSFKQMHVIGQFNLGFIIAKLNSDLFIVDQHASDEKFNFEKLENEYEIPVQPLISPITMEVTHQYYLLLQEHKELFRKNGFLFDDRAILGNPDTAERSVRFVEIIATPMSRSWSFGIPDVEEMLFLLQDFDISSRKAIRPSRVRQMFASRACRKSIMIGQGLKQHEMLNILKNLSQLEQPWNCPHGRPTMRHLMDMNLYKIDLCWNFDTLR